MNKSRQAGSNGANQRLAAADRRLRLLLPRLVALRALLLRPVLAMRFERDAPALLPRFAVLVVRRPAARLLELEPMFDF